jgi:hypothetical protein
MAKVGPRAVELGSVDPIPAAETPTSPASTTLPAEMEPSVVRAPFTVRLFEMNLVTRTHSLLSAPRCVIARARVCINRGELTWVSSGA